MESRSGPPPQKKQRKDGRRPAMKMTTHIMLNFMWAYALCGPAVVEWSTGIVYVDAVCGRETTNKEMVLGLLKLTVLGVAAFGCRCLGWQTPSPFSPTKTLAGMEEFARRRWLHKEDYKDDDEAPHMFEFTTDMRTQVGREHSENGEDAVHWRFESAFWLAMCVLPWPWCCFCDQRGRFTVFSRVKQWQTAEFAIRSMLYTVEDALKVMRIRVLDPYDNGAVKKDDKSARYFGKPRLFVNTMTAGDPGGLRAMLAFEPEDPGDLNVYRNAAIRARVRCPNTRARVESFDL